MSGLSEIQEAIEKLPEDQRRELRQWFDAFEDDGVPNAETIAAMEAARRGEVFSANSVGEFIAALNAHDEED